MIWTVLAIIAAVLIVVFAVFFVYISTRLFKIACERDSKPMSGDGFKKQMGEYREAIEEGKAFYSKQKKEEISVVSHDGLKLYGEFIRNGDGKKIVIEAHGFRSSPKRDFSVAMPYFYRKGFSFLHFDQRAHGKSEGEYITYGVNERYDLVEWINFAIREYGEDVEILLHGISMGAATVLMASGLDLPRNVKAIIADCGFTSPYDIYVHVLDTEYHTGPFPILNIAGIIAKKKAGFSFKDASATEALKKNEIPTLFVHGEDDGFVPLWMSEQNYKACKGEKEMLTVKGALHACSYLVDKEACERKMDAFLASKFKK